MTPVPPRATAGVHPVTGDPITNLTRVNLRLLEQMARPKTVYDDNVVEQLTFAEGTPASDEAQEGQGQRP
jgi:hypothetical protein